MAQGDEAKQRRMHDSKRPAVWITAVHWRLCWYQQNSRRQAEGAARRYHLILYQLSVSTEPNASSWLESTAQQSPPLNLMLFCTFQVTQM